ncbi:MAG: diadenylate cyclase CdaA [Bacteroidales bacterium]|jgi:uncharacterized protein (TIGR00159 family)|nr:diadenylate cyclase CdaA [Bacteroidales bacterium]
MPIFLFINFRIIDAIDILIVTVLLYQFYKLLKGTAAVKICIGIVIIYIIWLIVRAIDMSMLGTILGQVIGVGMIALIVVFQQEIRKFLLFLGEKYTNNNLKYLRNMKLSGDFSSDSINKISKAAIEMSLTKTGALIVISRDASLKSFAEYGEIINSNINVQLLKSIFFKDSPLHDGAVLVEKNKIYAAKCVLPLSDNPELQQGYGLRHRSALGMSEVSDTIVIVVSEQTGNISVAHDSRITKITNTEKLPKIIISFLEREKFEH